MKIDKLPMGARFEYRGEVYTKTGPMAAATDKGASLFIPRYAVLKLLDGATTPPPAAEKRMLEAEQVRAAFETYHRKVAVLVGDEGEEALNEARNRFLATLNLAG